MHPVDYMSGLNAAQLREAMSYDPESGLLVWLIRPSKRVHIGDIAGRKMASGYIQIKLFNKYYMAHRLAWLHYYGVWPSQRIDHINRIKTDNRIANLRDVSSSENSWNTGLHPSNKSGAPGVIWRPRFNRWQVSIKRQGKMHFVGNFIELNDAIAARVAAEKRFSA